MSWQFQAKHIGPNLTIEQLVPKIQDQLPISGEASDQIKAIGLILCAEIRRIQDDNPYSQYEFEVSAFGHTSSAKEPGSLSGTFAITWKR